MRKKLPILLLALIILLQVFVPAVHAASKNEVISSTVSFCSLDTTPEGAGKAVDKVPASLLQGSANTRVYLGIKDGATDYVGITKDIAKRQAQHGDRFDFLREITTEPVTRRQARAIEQAMKEANPSFSNKINSISPSRDWYNDAVNWGNNWLNSNGYLP